MNTKDDKKKYLVISAHPDDHDFGCGGAIAYLADKGFEVICCIITNGEKGTHKIKQTTAEMINMRETEQLNAGKVLGVSDVIFMRLTDGDLECDKETRKKITKIIRQVKPNIVISLDPGNSSFDSFYRFHRDHRMASEIVFDAIYPAVGSDAFFPELCDEECAPHQIDEVWFYGTDRPNLFIDVKPYIQRQIDALGKHDSQIKDIDAVKTYVYNLASDAGKRGGLELACEFRRLTF